MKVSDIKNRVKIGNESSADIFISIHLNKIPQKQYWGWQTFFKNGNEEGTLAIVGPKRMDYERVVSMLEFIKNQVED